MLRMQVSDGRYVLSICLLAVAGRWTVFIEFICRRLVYFFFVLPQEFLELLVFQTFLGREVLIEVDLKIRIYRHDIKEFYLGILRLDISYDLVQFWVLSLKVLVIWNVVGLCIIKTSALTTLASIPLFSKAFTWSLAKDIRGGITMANLFCLRAANW